MASFSEHLPHLYRIFKEPGFKIFNTSIPETHQLCCFLLKGHAFQKILNPLFNGQRSIFIWCSFLLFKSWFLHVAFYLSVFIHYAYDLRLSASSSCICNSVFLLML